MTERIILGVTLFGIMIAILVLAMINITAFFFRISYADFVFIFQDFLVICFMAVVIWIYLRGKTELASYLLLTALCLVSSFFFAPDALNRTMIIFVFPIMLASFVLTSSSSFLFASLSTLGYTVYYLANHGTITYAYNYLAVLVFFLVALISWTVAYFLKRANHEVTGAYEMTLEGWARALEMRDDETNGHSRRVVELTEKLARKLRRSEEEMINLRRGVMLHDIGKIGIPDHILLKPGPLDSEEWNLMHQHPILAMDLLSPIPYLQDALDIPYCHHERWDGSGYPRGLSGEDIPLPARLFAVVDVWDALTSDRPYRSAWPCQTAAKYLAEQSGKHFDPRIVPQFLGLLKEEGLV